MDGYSMAQIPEGYSTAARLEDAELSRLAEAVSQAPFVRRVLDAMPEMVAVLTPTRQLVAANQAMQIFLGLGEGEFRPGPRPGEILGCVHAQVSEHGCGNSAYCKQCGAFATIMEAIAQGRRSTGECRISRREAGRLEAMDLLLWCSPFGVEGLRFFVLAGVDISERKRRQALERAFFHDILNTSQSLGGCIELVSRAQPDQVRKLVPMLRRVNDYMLEEILSQRDMSLAENNELTASPALLNSRDLLERLRSLYTYRLTGRGADLRLAEDTESISFLSDPVLLSRVLGNMIKNALEASDPGQVVTLCARRQQDELLFTVHNPGYMPPEVQAQVFQRSFSTKGLGRGLGTYAMRLLSERYLEGGVDFESNQARGTVFRASLPVCPGYAGDLHKGLLRSEETS